MEKVNSDRGEDVVDLGAASAVTQGQGSVEFDNPSGQILAGILDD